MIEADLLKAAVAGKIPDRRHWADLVRQLGDNQFAKSEAADRMLRAVGPQVTGFLQQLDYGQLDAEQQFRVRRIIDSLHGSAAADTAEQVAERLVADSSVWLALLDGPEASTGTSRLNTSPECWESLSGSTQKPIRRRKRISVSYCGRSSNRPRLKRKRRLRAGPRAVGPHYPGDPMRLISLLICLAYWVLLSLLLLVSAHK